MRNLVRRGATLAAVAGLALAGTVGASSAAVAAPVAVAPVSVAAQSLPPYATWIADVTAVTDTAKAYLGARLPDRSVRAAVVLDIDNTALESEYHPDPFAPATAPVLALARQARAGGATVFFVTNRPDIIRLWTEGNLSSVGYQWGGLLMRPTFSGESAQTVKTSARVSIEGLGYTIVANIGNSVSDLAGGHAERTFKLPDYGGQLD
jgi:HAD superfamily, subfamily IIIB (Acid phosphatase)